MRTRTPENAHTRYEYIAEEGNLEAQVMFGTLLLEQASENTFHSLADSRSLASLFSSPRSSHDESLLQHRHAENGSSAAAAAAAAADGAGGRSVGENDDQGLGDQLADALSTAAAFVREYAGVALDGAGGGVALPETASGLASVKQWLLKVVDDAEAAEQAQRDERRRAREADGGDDDGDDGDGNGDSRGGDAGQAASAASA
jgi:hypothetical protein